MPTNEMLEELKRRLIYRDVNDLEKDLHKQKMLILFMSHQTLPKDRTDFHKFYNEYYFEFAYFARLICNREELWFKGQVEHYLKTTEPSYGVDLPANEFMTADMDEKSEATTLIARLFETMMIQQLRGPLDYDTQHDAWYDRYNELNENLDWFDEELTKIAHAVLLRDFEKYLYDGVDENDGEPDVKTCDDIEEETTEVESTEDKNIGYNIITYDIGDLSDDADEDTNEKSDKQ